MIPGSIVGLRVTLRRSAPRKNHEKPFFWGGHQGQQAQLPGVSPQWLGWISATDPCGFWASEGRNVRAPPPSRRVTQLGSGLHLGSPLNIMLIPSNGRLINAHGTQRAKPGEPAPL